jgi:CRP-like cAMP-binding protein
MADHTRNTLAAAARAMRDVIIPAVDRTDPLALEQAKIVAQVLEFVEQRIDHVHERARFELLHYRALVQEIREDVSAFSLALSAAIDQELESSAAIVADPAASTQAVADEATSLAELVSAGVRASQGETSGPRIELAVLNAARELLDMQRAWFLLQGWESDPSVVPALDAVFATRRQPQF